MSRLAEILIHSAPRLHGAIYGKIVRMSHGMDAIIGNEPCLVHGCVSLLAEMSCVCSSIKRKDR